jgi:hypothetical protein
LQIADLLRFGFSVRRIAHELARYPSTIKRELDRHRDAAGRYLPRTADHDARRQRARPRDTKLAANPRLRRLVQRKLNRCWSPDEICGWMKKTYPGDSSMRLCPETIYRELLLRDNTSLHKRYCTKLRTGRRVRSTRWLTRSGHGPTVTNRTMIDERPASVEDKVQAGHWEGDLIIGTAIGTLVERTTNYTMLLHLPDGYTPEGPGCADREDPDPARGPAGVVDLGPRLRDGAVETGQRGRRHRHLLLRPLTHLGNEPPTRTPTACCGSTSRRAATTPSTPQPTWTGLPPNSTTDNAND